MPKEKPLKTTTEQTATVKAAYITAIGGIIVGVIGLLSGPLSRGYAAESHINLSAIFTAGERLGAALQSAKDKDFVTAGDCLTAAHKAAVTSDAFSKEQIDEYFTTTKPNDYDLIGKRIVEMQSALSAKFPQQN
ncbi:MAG TPA: hypothetical protein VKV04_24620 [Verrucomicrobiae bacterium]|nr:hypothetical protein [Verrucomicrobiae bacterium]